LWHGTVGCPKEGSHTLWGVGQSVVSVPAQLPLITKAAELHFAPQNAIEVNSNIKRTIYACFKLD